MMNIRRMFETAVSDTVDEWKSHDQVKGIFTYGSYVRGTATAASDLDICMIWDGEEAPARLLAEHKGVIVDMGFITPNEIEAVLDGTTTDSFQIAVIVGRLRGARVHHDTKGMLKKWLQRASKYIWPAEIIEEVKSSALDALNRARAYVESEEYSAAIYEMRTGLSNLGRVILMNNQIFNIIKPSEVLTEVRMLDPMTYPIFLWTFKLKGVDEEDEMNEILDVVKSWIQKAIERYESAVDEVDETALALITEAQRYTHGAGRLAYNGEYELAIIDTRRAVELLGMSLLALGGNPVQEDENVVNTIRDYESEFYEQVLVEYGAFDLQPKAISRGIGEAMFVAQRL
ncbi:MAG: nucleotidyltransferase domain-containing protein [Candidatus Thorarchaeota archaeon]